MCLLDMNYFCAHKEINYNIFVRIREYNQKSFYTTKDTSFFQKSFRMLILYICLCSPHNCNFNTFTVTCIFINPQPSLLHQKHSQKIKTAI